ncbi:MAG: hypothetical protein IT290_08635 [Deltaproteobacteria bacterium]|nr:hypothetical protein [Deltaproteobacteria bacterium]
MRIRDTKDKETNEWLVAHAHERGRSVMLETKFLTQREYLVKVIATDGVLTGESRPARLKIAR